MTKVSIHIFLVVLSVFSISSTGIAQQLSRAERTVISKQAIKDLKDGTLIVRLKSKRNKINKLEELLAAPDLKEELRTRLNKELENTIDERNRFNLTLIDAFQENFTFANVYYMYDTASVSLINGSKSGIFLTTELELDPAIQIPAGKFFVIRTGTTDSSSTTGVEALVIMDDQLEDLFRPFPYYTRVNYIDRLFVFIFNHKHLIKKDSKRVVQKFQQKLNQFYQEVY